MLRKYKVKHFKTKRKTKNEYARKGLITKTNIMKLGKIDVKELITLAGSGFGTFIAIKNYNDWLTAALLGVPTLIFLSSAAKDDNVFEITEGTEPQLEKLTATELIMVGAMAWGGFRLLGNRETAAKTAGYVSIASAALMLLNSTKNDAKLLLDK